MAAGFDDGVHGVRDGERMRPVVIRHLAVILPHRQGEAEQVVHVKPGRDRKPATYILAPWLCP